MTRLLGEWMRSLVDKLDAREEELQLKTGLDFAGVAAAANGLPREAVEEAAKRLSVFAVPITQGLGVIEAFAESVAAIVERAGFSAFVTERTDVSGFYEAYRRGADIVFLADDVRYVAFRLDARRLSDNNEATARGYAAALEAAAGGLAGRDVLVVGCGVVGREAGKSLVAKGARRTRGAPSSGTLPASGGTPSSSMRRTRADGSGTGCSGRTHGWRRPACRSPSTRPRCGATARASSTTISKSERSRCWARCAS